MKQRTLAKWLKFIILGVGACALVIYAVVVPMLGRTVVEAENGALDAWFWPWMGFIWATGIPCAIALGLAWKIADNIGQDRSFSLSNARLLKWISVLAAGDAAFFFAGNILFLLLDMSHPGVVLFAMLIVFAGVAISVAAAALSHLVMKAEVLQDQSDWTI